jgi:hypothetical protein
MRWKNSDEEVTGILAIFMILATLAVIGSDLWRLAH